MDRTAFLLRELLEHPRITQRALAGRLSMSLGSVNALLADAAARGLTDPEERVITEKGRAFLEPYRRRQAAFGRTIEVLALGREPRKALATDVDSDFRLVVRYEDGREEHLSSGEMRIIISGED